jgi:hypothetical protein
MDTESTALDAVEQPLTRLAISGMDTEPTALDAAEQPLTPLAGSGMDTEPPALDAAEPLSALEAYGRAILDRITRLQAVVSEQFEVAVVFPISLGTSQSMRVHTITPVEPDLLAFNGLLDNHTPATVLLQISNLQLAFITRKRYETSQKTMTAFGFKNEAKNEWS